MLKILFALPGFHKYDRGAEVALLSVARELSNLGDQVTVMGSGQPREGTGYKFRHLPSVSRERFERFPTLPMFRNETAWEDATFSANLLRNYDPAAYDATITCSYPFTHWALRRPAAKRPASIFVTQNGDWPAQSNRSEFRLFQCDGLVCTNPEFYERNRNLWNCALIPNGADLDRFTPGAGARQRFGLPADKKILLMVSALIPTKRVLGGIRAAARHEDCFLVVAGDGPLRAEAQALADKLLPGRFKRLTLGAADMPLLYQSADAFMHLSLLESFGNVFVEALATGLPIIGHDTDRLRWIVGDDAFLGDTEDGTALDALIGAALRSDRKARSPSIERFSWATIAAQYRDFILKTTGASGT